MTEPDIAVVIVTYRTAQLTIDALDPSRRNESRPGLRLRAIVVDNASGDLPAIAQAAEQNAWSSWVKLVLRHTTAGLRTATTSASRTPIRSGCPITSTCSIRTRRSDPAASRRWSGS